MPNIIMHYVKTLSVYPPSICVSGPFCHSFFDGKQTQCMAHIKTTYLLSLFFSAPSPCPPPKEELWQSQTFSGLFPFQFLMNICDKDSPNDNCLLQDSFFFFFPESHQVSCSAPGLLCFRGLAGQLEGASPSEALQKNYSINILTFSERKWKISSNKFVFLCLDLERETLEWI